MRTRRRHQRQQRQELEGIAAFGDVNELTISGHVEQAPQLRQDEYGERVCRFVLTHTCTDAFGNRWERQHYDVTAYAQLGERYATSWQLGQAVLITGCLEHQLHQTLAGPVRSASIHAHTIDTTLAQHPLIHAPLEADG